MPDITVHVMIKNEQYWIGAILSNVLKVFDKVLVAECGSQDGTAEILSRLNDKYPDKMTVFSLGDLDNDEQGKVRQFLTDQTKTEWAVIVDGDEFYSVPALESLRDTELEDNIKLGFSGLTVVDFDSSKDAFVRRESFSRHLLFNVPITSWSGPFPGEMPTPFVLDLPQGSSFYYSELFGYDLRVLPRSPLDEITRYRLLKDKTTFRPLCPITGPCPELLSLLENTDYTEEALKVIRGLPVPRTI